MCASAFSSPIVESSRNVEWTSVLLDHYVVQPVEETFETRPTPDQTIVVLARGEQRLGVYRSGQWQFATYRSGTVGMTPGGDVDRLRRSSNGSFEKTNLYVPTRFFEEAADHYRRAGQRHRNLRMRSLAFDDLAIAGVVGALRRNVALGAPDLYAETAMRWLARHLLFAHGSHTTSAEGVERRIVERRLARVLEYMSAHYAEPLSLHRLASEACVSDFHFARLFRDAVGLAPHEHLVALRMAAAQRLLLESDMSVGEIAAACGFSGPSYFGTAFRKKYQQSPTEYRRERDNHVSRPS